MRSPPTEILERRCDAVQIAEVLVGIVECQDGRERLFENVGRQPIPPARGFGCGFDLTQLASPHLSHCFTAGDRLISPLAVMARHADHGCIDRHRGCGLVDHPVGDLEDLVHRSILSASRLRLSWHRRVDRIVPPPVGGPTMSLGLIRRDVG